MRLALPQTAWPPLGHMDLLNLLKIPVKYVFFFLIVHVRNWRGAGAQSHPSTPGLLAQILGFSHSCV